MRQIDIFFPCLGWVCYAEKTHEFVLPFVSCVKSPQQIMGSIVKDYLAAQKNLHPTDIYHVTLMPCYDKKLEASRLDFFNANLNSKDVDCVITPGTIFIVVPHQTTRIWFTTSLLRPVLKNLAFIQKILRLRTNILLVIVVFSLFLAVELELLFQSENITLSNIDPQPLDVLNELDSSNEIVSINAGSFSGGYAYQILLRAAKELLFDSSAEIQFKSTRYAYSSE